MFKSAIEVINARKTLEAAVAAKPTAEQVEAVSNALNEYASSLTGEDFINVEIKAREFGSLTPACTRAFAGQGNTIAKHLEEAGYLPSVSSIHSATDSFDHASINIVIKMPVVETQMVLRPVNPINSINRM
jgi:hypothetical protein